MKFAESELILSKDGRIYHLNLLPEEISDTIITVGDPDRVPAVSKYFDSIELKQQKREFVTHTGYIGKKRISVISTGISTDNIDIVLNELDALHNICFQSRAEKTAPKRLSIIRIGTSGAMQPDIAVDSTVLSTDALGFDGLLHFYQLEQHAHEIEFVDALSKHFGEAFPINPLLISAAERYKTLFASFTVPGVTVTCGGFYAPQSRHLRAKPRYHNLLDRLASFNHGNQRLTNFEMETAGIYGLGRMLDFDCCSLSAIVANRALGQFSRDSEKAIDALIQNTLQHLAAQ